jgi:RNA polymerase sigma-70 factor (ECF subfamily)
LIDERQLLHNLKKKKRNSLDEIIKLYIPYVSVIIYNTIGSIVTKEDIEETISDSFLLLWQHANDISNEKGCIRSYLGAIARNNAKNKLRGYVVTKELNEWSGIIKIESTNTKKSDIIKTERKVF